MCESMECRNACERTRQAEVDQCDRASRGQETGSERSRIWNACYENARKESYLCVDQCKDECEGYYRN